MSRRIVDAGPCRGALGVYFDDASCVLVRPHFGGVIHAVDVYDGRTRRVRIDLYPSRDQAAAAAAREALALLGGAS